MLSTPLIQHFNARTPLRAGSLIVTVFGDCIAPRGGTVWLGSLIEVLSHLGISVPQFPANLDNCLILYIGITPGTIGTFIDFF